MSEKKKDKYNMYEDNNQDPPVVLSTEMTGLVQAPPNNPEEEASVANLANAPKAKKSKVNEPVL